MKKIAYALIVLAFLLSCSSFSTKTEMSKGRAIGKIKRVGLIYRVSKHSRIAAGDYAKNFMHWLNACDSAEKIVVASECSAELCSFSGDDDKFFQLSDTGRFLSFKATGVIKSYLLKNDAELKKLIAEKNLDAVLVYEVYSIVSSEMQFIEFESVLLIVDKDLKMIHLDRQADSFDSDEMTFERMRTHLLDKISRRLMDTLYELKLVK